MSYIIVTNSVGDMVCYGPNDGMYEPGIPDGCTLSIVEVLPPLPPIPYQQLRAAAYPPIGDQLDDLFRQGAFSPEMAATLQAVKTAHPKGR